MSDDPGAEAGPRGLALILGLVVKALPVSAACLLVSEAGGLRVVARAGAGAIDETHLIASLPQSSLCEGEATALLHVRQATGSLCGATAVALTGDATRFGHLVVLNPNEGEPLTACQLSILEDLAALAAGQIGPPRHAPGLDRPRAVDHDRRLSEAIEALPEAIAIFDREARFVQWNRKFERLYTGPGIELRPGLRFEDHLRASVALGRVPAAVGREDEWIADRLARFYAAEGAHEHRLASGHCVRVQDRRLSDGGWIGIRSDIADIAEREQSFRLLFDANPAPMLVFDRHTLEILSVNDAACIFYGYARADFLGMTLPQIRPEREPGEIHQLIERLGEADFSDRPRFHRTASGEERIVKVIARLLDYAGRVRQGYVG